MSEEVKAVETKSVEPVVEAPKAVEPQIGMNDVLSPRGKSHQAPEERPGGEGPTPVVEAKAQEKVLETPEEKEPLVPVKAVQAERKKRQEVQQRLMELQRQNEELMAQGSIAPDTSALEADTKKQMMAIADISSRAIHPDYQEKFDAFQSAVFDGEQINSSLYESIINSDHPGEAAYNAGKQILFIKKYGTDLDSQVKALKEETRAELKEELRKEVEAEMLGKIQTKQNQPTNLLTTRSAGSPSDRPFVQPSFGDVLQAKRRR